MENLFFVFSVSRSVNAFILYHVVRDRHDGKSVVWLMQTPQVQKKNKKQFRLTNRISSKSNVLVNRSRTILSIPRYLVVDQFLRIVTEWIVDVVLLQICFQFIPMRMTLNPIINSQTRVCSASCNVDCDNHWILKCKQSATVAYNGLLRAYLITLSLSLGTSSNMICWSSSIRLFNTAGVTVPASRLGWLGSSLLLATAFESQSFR